MADIDIEIDITSSQQEQPDIDVHPVYGPKGANGANGRSATIEVGTVRTGAAGTTAIITNSGDTSNAVFNFTIPKGDTGEQGIQGETGATGNGIETIEKTSTSGLVDTYTITYTDDTTSTFTVTNGQNGADGQNGENATITGATASVDNSTGTPSVVVTAGGSESARSFNFAFSNLKGSKGEQGEQGETGVSVTGVTLLSTVGLDKTYRMTFSDNTYFDYVVSNGASGSTQWGGILGTLSNQTDLQNALDAKYNASNPNGFTDNKGTVTSVNNTSPDSSGNVTISIPAAQIQSDWSQSDNTKKDFIKNKPTALSSFTDDLGTSPTHTHSQYVTDISGKEDKNKTINVLSTSGTITLTDNSINSIAPTDAVTFTLPTVTDNTKFHQILVQVNLSTVYSLTLGTTYYFNKTAPDMSATGVYNLIYEYDKANQYWVCGVLSKGASS